MLTFPPHARFLFLAAGAAVLATAFAVPGSARVLCVSPTGFGCYRNIQAAVNAAAANDVINVGPGTYYGGVVIGVPLSLLGAGAAVTTINATGQPNGVLIDGFHYPGLNHVTVSGFTVENALYEGILAVSSAEITISNNNVINNDSTQGLEFTGAPQGCPGQPAYETDETGDCGGAIHLNGTSNSVVSGNFIIGNADGLLISDDTAMASGNTVTGNYILNNPLECGIVLASHDPYGSKPPFFAPHYGVNNNTLTNNVSIANGVQIGGSGLGFFSDGAGPGTVSGNLAGNNWLVGNGIGGVNLHSHVGPAFGAPADNLDNNTITGNYIASNLADTADTATPGRVGINISSGGGGSPVSGTVISLNVIEDEDVDVAVNTASPAVVEIHQNDLLACTGPQCMLNIGVANVCAFDHGTSCGGLIDATENYWGCPGGPGAAACSTINPTYSANISFSPFLTTPNPPITRSVPASGNACNGPYNGTFPGDLTVSAGQICIFTGGGVTGSITVTGGFLVLFNASVGGNVQIQGGGFSISSTNIQGNVQIQNLPASSIQNQLCGATVHGNLTYQGSDAPVTIGAPQLKVIQVSVCPGNAVEGNLLVQNNAAPVTIFDNTVNGNLQVQSNYAAVIASMNKVGNDMQVENNAASVQVFNDVVTNNLLCGHNSSIAGGGDTAGRLQGQCASF